MIPNLTYISAGAGSGKTHRLVRLLGDRLAAGSVAPRNLLAVTFTEKAAVELRTRVRRHLAGAGMHEILGSLDEALIGTVNGVCGRLLERFAYEAGLAPDLQVLSEREQPRLFALAIDRTLTVAQMDELDRLARRLEIEDWRLPLAEIVNLARANGVRPEGLAAHAQYSADALLEHFPPAESADLDAALRASVSEALTALEDNDDHTKVTRRYRDLLERVAHRQRSDALPWSDWLRLLDATAPAKASRPLVASVKHCAERFDRHPRLHGDLRRWTELLFDVAARAWSTYQRLKAERGLVDFVDQEQQTLRLLDKPTVAQALGDELRLFVVDEFQDTSPIQLAVFLKIGALSDESIWVGDAKQAIYGFRGADADLVQTVLARARGMGANTEALDTCRRSTEPLVELVNSLFVPAFADRLDAVHVRQSAVREHSAPGPALRFWRLRDSRVQQRAAALAQGIERLLTSAEVVSDPATGDARAVQPRDVAVLCRTRERADAVAAALSARGLPVDHERPGLMATPEACLLIAGLRRLLDPKDTLASAELLALDAALEPEQWLNARLDYLDAGHAPDRWGLVEGARHAALARIDALRDCSVGRGPSEWLDALIEHAGMRRAIRDWGPTSSRVRQRLRNLERLRELARDYEEHASRTQRGASPGGLLLWFRRLGERAEDSIVADPDIPAIQVLTHHAAKGLEWPIVVAMDLESEVRANLWGVSADSEAESFDPLRPLEGRRLRYWPWPFGRLRKGIDVAARIENSLIGRQAHDKAVHEAQRLLYVSFTRTRDCLILALQDRAKARPWLDTLNAPWFQPGSSVLLSGEGYEIASEEEVLCAGDVATSARRAIFSFWPCPASRRVDHPAARLAPADQPAVPNARLGRSLRLPGAIGVPELSDARDAGRLMHGLFARYLMQPDRCDRNAFGQSLVDSGLDAATEYSRWIDYLQAFNETLHRVFKPARTLVEWPVQAVNDEGVMVSGWIDLLLETPQGWVVIDHKFMPATPETAERAALNYSGQLAAYAQSVTAATQSRVASCWVHFPTAGWLREVQVAGGSSGAPTDMA